MILPNAMDGAADVTQKPIEPGETFTYEFTATAGGHLLLPLPQGADRQQGLGMYGALIVDPEDPAVDAAYDYDKEMVVQLQEWLHRDGYTYPAMTMEGASRTTSPSTASPIRTPRRSTWRSGKGCGSASSAPTTTSCTPCTSTVARSGSWRPTANVVPEEARLLKDTVNVGPASATT